jgi:YVTN family beta-propeller protein
VVQAAPTNAVSVIDTVSHAVVATIPVGTNPQTVAITPNGSFAYVTNPGNNNVSVISTATNTVIGSVPVGSLPSGVAVTPSGAFAYVTNESTNDVSVIATASNTVVDTVSVGNRPIGIAFTRLAAPTDKDQCKNGGYRSFTNPSFKNQGECVSFVQRNHLPGVQ